MLRTPTRPVEAVTSWVQPIQSSPSADDVEHRLELDRRRLSRTELLLERGATLGDVGPEPLHERRRPRRRPARRPPRRRARWSSGRPGTRRSRRTASRRWRRTGPRSVARANCCGSSTGCSRVSSPKAGSGRTSSSSSNRSISWTGGAVSGRARRRRPARLVGGGGRGGRGGVGGAAPGEAPADHGDRHDQPRRPTGATGARGARREEGPRTSRRSDGAHPREAGSPHAAQRPDQPGTDRSRTPASTWVSTMRATAAGSARSLAPWLPM